MRRVVVHVERLVRCFHADDDHGVAAGLDLELERVFAVRGAEQLGRVGYVERLAVGPVEARGQVGRAAATAIGGRLTGNVRSPR